jgi:hypothetical protein
MPKEQHYKERNDELWDVFSQLCADYKVRFFIRNGYQGFI